MADAMGSTGVEGMFRRSCEETLRVLRNNRDSLMGVLETFINDPLLEWKKAKIVGDILIQIVITLSDSWSPFSSAYLRSIQRTGTTCLLTSKQRNI
jgi:phosphatidylinositol kinase/protein kinase (PI-3  family)